MRRKRGALVPLEVSILLSASHLQRTASSAFHGYQLAKHLADVSDRRRLTAYGTLYRALWRLEAMGLVESRWEDPQIAADENRPGRRLYTLTDAGLAAARAAGREARASRAPARRAKLARA